MKVWSCTLVALYHLRILNSYKTPYPERKAGSTVLKGNLSSIYAANKSFQPTDPKQVVRLSVTNAVSPPIDPMYHVCDRP